MYVSLSSQVSEGHRRDLLAEADRLSQVAQALREPKAGRHQRVATGLLRPLRSGLALGAAVIHALIR
jgi:hypothetical protein